MNALEWIDILAFAYKVASLNACPAFNVVFASYGDKVCRVEASGGMAAVNYFVPYQWSRFRRFFSRTLKFVPPDDARNWKTHLAVLHSKLLGARLSSNQSTGVI